MHMLPPWSASMVMAARRQTHRGQEYRGRAAQGAVLNKQAFRLGCHRTRTYTMTTRCSISGELQRSSQASTSTTVSNLDPMKSAHYEYLHQCMSMHMLPPWSASMVMAACGRHTVVRNIKVGHSKELCSTSRPVV